MINWRSPVVVLSVSVMSLLCVIDGVLRFSHEGKQQHFKMISEPDLNYRASAISDAHRQAVYAKYDAYLESEAVEETDTVKSLSQEEQSAQSGVLQEVFVDDKRLTLKAVINRQVASHQQVSLLINVLDLKNNNEEIFRFNESDKIFGYIWTYISNTQIEIKKGDSQQKVVLTMYKPANREKGK
ncbi:MULTISPECIES: hypothetical protein [Pseudoalteromonas]|uniref:General secretion pathway protein GspM n=1 Tax=Pseudoalteromonas aurantia 208 TaxID=1314867 RepID=A0ABR9EE73_9GAMM|nr:MULTISPECIES: hypothetical protein [Pseudoalteromonas]MBE0369291.1 hypothetical protein [Pseudoalteromonas aurantia 208]MBQ4844350.1 hypothetical protein [Pseudoalteromonas sp. MMG005]